MKAAVLVFPGSNREGDVAQAIELVTGRRPQMVWHGDGDFEKADLIVVPGGFSYGDYLRTGAIARFSPVMQDVVRFAHDGGLVLGVCNGFQILCEAGLLPGALLRNRGLRFRCKSQHVRVENAGTPFTNACTVGDVLDLPIAHSDGAYYADEATLDRLEANGQVVLRYVDASGQATAAANPNGASRGIAGIVNERGNVLGMMPHPERHVEALLGSTDGAAIFRSLLAAEATA